MPFSNTYAQQILNYTLGKTKTLTAPSYVYLGLSSNDPEAAGGNFAELSGGNYARVLISQTGETYPDLIGTASDRAIGNSKQINWNKASADWATAKGFGLFPSATGGTPFFYAKLDAPVTVPQGAVALFEPDGFGLNFPNKDAE